MVLAGCPRCRGDLRYAPDAGAGAGEFCCLTCGHTLYVCPTCLAGIRVQHGEGMACSRAPLCGWTLDYEAPVHEGWRGQAPRVFVEDGERYRGSGLASEKRCANCTERVGDDVYHPLSAFSRVRRSDQAGEHYRYLSSCRESRNEVEILRRAGTLPRPVRIGVPAAGPAPPIRRAE